MAIFDQIKSYQKIFQGLENSKLECFYVQTKNLIMYQEFS